MSLIQKQLIGLHHIGLGHCQQDLANPAKNASAISNLKSIYREMAKFSDQPCEIFDTIVEELGVSANHPAILRAREDLNLPALGLAA